MKLQLIIVLLLFQITGNVKGQLKADAGNNSAYCNWKEILHLGSNPSASGGEEPYSYYWKCLKCGSYASDQLFTTDLIDDSTIANPLLNINVPLNDTLIFELKVKDVTNEVAFDTIQIFVSSIVLRHQIYFSPTIYEGDTIEIYPVNIYNGIPPFSYRWSPEAGLSNPMIKNPLAFPDSSIEYTVVVTDTLGCKAGDRVNISVQPVSVNQSRPKYTANEWRFYPNPVRGTLFYECPYLFATGTLIITDLTGRLRITKNITELNGNINLANLESGIYILSIISNNENANQILKVL